MGAHGWPTASLNCRSTWKTSTGSNDHPTSSKYGRTAATTSGG